MHLSNLYALRESLSGLTHALFLPCLSVCPCFLPGLAPTNIFFGCAFLFVLLGWVGMKTVFHLYYYNVKTPYHIQLFICLLVDLLPPILYCLIQLY